MTCKVGLPHKIFGCDNARLAYLIRIEASASKNNIPFDVILLGLKFITKISMSSIIICFVDLYA